MKTIKKFQLPPGPGLYVPLSGGGGGGGASALYTANPALTLDDSNPSTTFRVSVPITGTSGTQVRVTLTPGPGSLTILHASIGKWAPTGVGWETTATPLELLFGGTSGFVGATTNQVSNWLNLSGLTFTTGDRAIIIYDIPSGSAASQKRATSSTGVNTYYRGSGAETWNLSYTTPMNTLADTNYCIAALETQ